MIDLDALLADTVEKPPCGPDLEYDPAFQALEEVARERPEQQFGATVIAAQEPRWAEVRAGAEALLRRSKDLRVATLLARALVKTEGFSALECGLEIIRRLIETHWDEVHPRLDPGEDFDPTIRLSALAPLVDAAVLLRDVRAASVLPQRFGGLKVRDVECAVGRMPVRNGEEPLTQRQVEAMFAEALVADPGIAPSVRRTLATARALSGALVERVGTGRAPDFGPLIGVLGLLDEVCTRSAPVTHVHEVAAGAQTGEDGGAAPTRLQAEVAMTGEIRNREDALQMLDRIIDYFERNEPTNPAPLLIKRARRLVSMNFVDIIKDMAPDSLKQIESIAGPRANE